MTFWSVPDLQPLRKYNFKVRLGSSNDLSFLAKSVTKPVLETEVNEYRLINQIVKFPSIPRWNDINIKYTDTAQNKIYEDLLELMMGKQDLDKEWVPDAIKKEDVNLVVEQYDSGGKLVSSWFFKNAFIKSIDFGDNSYSDDELIEIDVNVAYDYAYLE